MDLSNQNPQILKLMVEAYEKYAQVGVVVPSNPIIPPDLYQAATMVLADHVAHSSLP